MHVCMYVSIYLSRTQFRLEQFLPHTIRDWNSLIDSLLSAAECASKKVSKALFKVGKLCITIQHKLLRTFEATAKT